MKPIENNTSMKSGMQQTSMRSRIGVYLVGIGFISPVFALIVPLFGLPTNINAWLITFFLVGAPEIFLILGAALAGKEGVALVKNKFKALFRRVFKGDQEPSSI